MLCITDTKKERIETPSRKNNHIKQTSFPKCYVLGVRIGIHIPFPNTFQTLRAAISSTALIVCVGQRVNVNLASFFTFLFGRFVCKSDIYLFNYVLFVCLDLFVSLVSPGRQIATGQGMNVLSCVCLEANNALSLVSLEKKKIYCD